MLLWKSLRWLTRKLRRLTFALDGISARAEHAVGMHVYELENHPDDVHGIRSWWGR